MDETGDVLNQDSLAALFETIVKDRRLAREIANALQYNRMLIVGMLPNGVVEVSWSGCKAVEVTTMVIHAARTVFDHLDADGTQMHWRAMIEKITEHRDKIIGDAAEEKFRG